MHVLLSSIDSYRPTSNSAANAIIPSSWAIYLERLQEADDKSKPYDICGNLGDKGKPLPKWMDSILDELLNIGD